MKKIIKRNQDKQRKSLKNHFQFEVLEPRRVLAAGVGSNDCAPDLDLTGISTQTILTGQLFTLDLLQSGATITDVDTSGSPTGDQIRFQLDPDVPEDTPVGIEISENGILSWTPTAGQVGTYRIVIIAIDSGSPPLADAEVLNLEVDEGSSGNLAPVLDLNGPGDGTGFNAAFIENGGQVATTAASMTVSDSDNTQLSSATVSITNLLDGSAESLSATTIGTLISSTYDSSTGTLSLIGTDSLENYQLVLRSVVYENSSESPDTTSRQIDFVVSDGSLSSNVAVSLVSIESVNDAPNLAPIADQTTNVGSLFEVDVSATDVDGDNLTFQLDRDDIGANTPAGATIANNNDGTATIFWTPEESDGAGPFTFVVLVTDDADSPLSDRESFQVTLLSGEGSPSIDLNGSGDGTGYAGVFTENGGGVPVATDTAAVTHSNGESILSMSVVISNLLDGTAESLSADVAGTSIIQLYDASTGTLQFTGAASAADYQQVLTTVRYDNSSEAPNGTARTIFVSVGDGTTITTATTTMNMIGENDAPDLAQINDQLVNLGETLEVVVTATDVDSAVLTFQLDRDDPRANTPVAATLTNNNDGTATISWTPTGSDGVGPFSFVVLVTDDDGTSPRSDREEFNVTVATANGSPILDLDGTGAGTGYTGVFTEDGGGVPVAADTATVGHTIDAILISMRVVISNLLDGDSELLSADVTGTSIASSYDSSNGTLRLTGDATAAIYQQVLQTVRYNNVSNAPNGIARSILVTVRDRATSVDAEATINVIGENDAPDLAEIADRSISVGQTLEVVVSATDIDSSIITFEFDRDDVEGDIPAAATITNNNDGTATISWTPVQADADSEFKFVVVATDDHPSSPLSDREVFEVSVTAETDTIAPQVQSAPSGNFSNSFSAFDVIFSEAMQSSAFDSENYMLEIVGGPNDGQSVPILNATESDSQTATVSLLENLVSGSYRLTLAADSILDLAGNALEGTTNFDFTINAAARIASHSPGAGEEMVALTRETIVRFSDRVDPSTVDSDSFYLIANGTRVAGQIRVSSTEKFATFFYADPLPSSTQVRVVIDGDRIIDRNGLSLNANGDGQEGGMLQYNFRTLPLTFIPATQLFGYIYDSYNQDTEGNDIPIIGATISLDANPAVRAVTDENGYFELGLQDLNNDGNEDGLPAPEFFVHIDGSTAQNAPNGSTYATLGKPFHSIPGQRVQLEMDGEAFDIYLPPMATDDIVELNADDDTEVGFGPTAEAQIREMFADDPARAQMIIDNMTVTYPAGSALDQDGNAATRATIIPVDPNRLPAPLPFGMEPELVVSIQAGTIDGFNLDGGSTNFDVPAPIVFPNIKDLPVGTRQEFFSFDHDKGAWVSIGRGLVQELIGGGTAIMPDAGVGILAPGWHTVDRPTSAPPPGPGGKNPNPRRYIAECYIKNAYKPWNIGACIMGHNTRHILCAFNQSSGEGSHADGPFSRGTNISARLLELLNDSISNAIQDLHIQADTLIQPYVETGQEVPSEVVTQLDELEAAANEVAGGDAVEYMRSIELEIESLSNDQMDVLAPGDGPEYPVRYLATFVSIEGTEIQVRGETEAFGQYRLFVPDNTTLRSVEFYDAQTNSYGWVAGRLDPNARYQIPGFYLNAITEDFVDADGDGLADVAERVVGTIRSDVDSDDDGINDFTEVSTGLDPLDGRAFPVGVIATLDLPDSARSVEVIEGADGTRVAVAVTDSGLVTIDATQFDQPVVLGQLGLNGNPVDVGFDPLSSTVVVAAGQGGLHFVDVTDSMFPNRVRTVSGNVSAVEVIDGIAYAAVNSRIISYDVLSGELLTPTNISDGAEITDLAHDGDVLFSMDENGLFSSFEVRQFQLVQLGSITVDQGAGNISVSGNVAYAAAINAYARGGFSTIDVSDPSAMTVISGSDIGSPLVGPGTSIVANGSGFGLLVGSAGGQHMVDLVNLENPENTNEFINRFGLDSAPLNVAIASGIAFVAGGTAGLHVLNYVSFDNQGVAPIVTALGPQETEVQEGSFVPFRINVTDDVQVRDVELLMDGVVVARDISAPFDLRAITPSLASGAIEVSFQVRATDTGGNVGLSNVVTYTLTPDVTGPVLINSTPTDTGAGFRVRAITLRFDEPLDTSVLGISGISLIDLGDNFQIGGGDDTVIPLDRVEALSPRRIVVFTTDELGEGRFRLEINANNVSDIAGNTLDEPIAIEFTSFDLDEQNSIAWISDEDGDWNNAGNWSSGKVPGPNDAVIIDRQTANPTITISEGDIVIRSLVSRDSLLITGGSLTISEASEIQANLEMTGGSITADGAEALFTVAGEANVSSGSLIALNGGLISLPSLLNLEHNSTANSQYVTLRATGTNSAINLPNVTTITNGSHYDSNIQVEALTGGKVDLRGVNSIVESNSGDFRYRAVRFTSDGSNSQIDLSSLVNFIDLNAGGDAGGGESRYSSLSTINGGTILVPNLENLQGVRVVASDNTALNFEVWENFTEGRLELGVDDFVFENLVNLSGSDIVVNGVSADLSQVTTMPRGRVVVTGGGSVSLDNLSLADSTSFDVSGGVTLSLPSLVNYSHSSTANSQYRTFRSSGVGSVLDMSNLTTITNGTHFDSNIQVDASTGGLVDLGGVTSITEPNSGDFRYRAVRFTADGSESQIVLSSLVNFIDLNAGGNDGGGESRYSTLSTVNGGAILVPILENLQGIRVVSSDNAAMNFGVWENFTEGRLELSGDDFVFTSLVNLSGSDLVVNGVSADLSQVTTMPRGSVVVTGGGNANLDNLSMADNASFEVNGGVTLSLPSLANYSHGSTANSQYRTFKANGAGSVLDLSNLTTITNGTHFDSNIQVDASTGGLIDLGRVTSIAEPNSGDFRYRAVRFTADGTNSQIDLSSLVNFIDLNAGGNDGGGESRYSTLVTANGGAILVPILENLQGIRVVMTDNTALNVDAWENFTEGRLELSGDDFVFSNLANLSGSDLVVNGISADLSQVTTMPRGRVVVTGGGNANLDNLSMADNTSFEVSGSVTLSLPALANYNHGSTGNSQYRIFKSSGTGSVLDLSNLTTITNGTHFDSNIQIEALTGGLVDLGSVTSITEPNSGDFRYRAVRFTADGSNSQVDLSSLVNFVDLNAGEDDNGGESRYSTLTTVNGGVILSQNLENLQGIRVVASDNSAMSFQVWENFTEGRLELSGDEFEFANLVNLSGSDLVVTGTAADLSQVTTMPRGRVFVASGGTTNLDNLALANNTSFDVSDGVTLSLPSLLNYSHGSTGNSQYRVFRASGAGSVLDLGNLNSITNGTHYDSNIQIEALAGGQVDLGGVSSISEPNSGDFRYRAVRITADGNNSQIDLSVLINFIDLNASGDGDGGQTRYSTLTATSNATIVATMLTNMQGVLVTEEKGGSVQLPSATRLSLRVNTLLQDAKEDSKDEVKTDYDSTRGLSSRSVVAPALSLSIDYEIEHDPVDEFFANSNVDSTLVGELDEDEVHLIDNTN